MQTLENKEKSVCSNDWRLSVAPMMAWTDRHCRFLHRLLTRHTLLYTEMITTGALLHGDVPKHLRFRDEEHPLALQLGGSEPQDLAAAARLAQQWGYDEVNLNCGCPSERVKKGAFGACLMNEPTTVADSVKAMRDAVDIPVTVKHRIGIDKIEHYGFVRDFVGEVAAAGCDVFIVHARNAWLQGLSPKENREIPPLRYDFAHQLKQDFPSLTIVVNGGITTNAQITEQLAHVDGVMVGRQAYHYPRWLGQWDERFFGESARTVDTDAIEAAYVDYMETEAREHGTPWYGMACHMLGLRHGEAGARVWRRAWSDHHMKNTPVREVYAAANAERLHAVAHVEAHAERRMHSGDDSTHGGQTS